MISRETVLNVADNSGALLVKCIGIPGGTNKRIAKVGEEIVCSIISVKPNVTSRGTKVTKGSVRRAIVIRTVSQIRRKDGSHISFSDNSVVLLDNAGKFFSTRVFGRVPRELQYSKAPKVLSFAQGVV